MTFKENGHVWDSEQEGIRCNRCQIRIEYYRALKKASIEQPERDFTNALKCKAGDHHE